jgi:hypothetical protein
LELCHKAGQSLTPMAVRAFLGQGNLGQGFIDIREHEQWVIAKTMLATALVDY